MRLSDPASGWTLLQSISPSKTPGREGAGGYARVASHTGQVGMLGLVARVLEMNTREEFVSTQWREAHVHAAAPVATQGPRSRSRTGPGCTYLAKLDRSKQALPWPTSYCEAKGLAMPKTTTPALSTSHGVRIGKYYLQIMEASHKKFQTCRTLWTIQFVSMFLSNTMISIPGATIVF